MSELVVGRIAAVAEHPGARAPSLLLELDLGPHGRHEVVLPTGGYEPSELEEAQVLCRRDADGVRLVGAHSHERGLVLLRPDHRVENGALVD
jgi:tRNA-binding EMAP/Myf-like protein